MKYVYPCDVVLDEKAEREAYVVTFPDLPGCIADGKTMDDAMEEARDAFTAWTAAEMGAKGTLPAPKTDTGQFVLRTSRTLHVRLAKQAASEGVSLNQLASTLLARGLAQG